MKHETMIYNAVEDALIVGENIGYVPPTDEYIDKTYREVMVFLFGEDLTNAIFAEAITHDDYSGNGHESYCKNNSALRAYIPINIVDDVSPRSRINQYYHTSWHAIVTAKRLMQVMAYASNESVYDFNLRKVMVLAAVLHDYDHSRGALPDWVNVHTAESILTPESTMSLKGRRFGYHYPRAFGKQYGVQMMTALLKPDYNAAHVTCADSLDMSVSLMALAGAFIGDSLFPYQDFRNPKWDFYSTMFRACDLTSSADDSWYDLIYVGLYAELLESGKIKPDFKLFCRNQLSFVKGIFTQYIPVPNFRNSSDADIWHNFITDHQGLMIDRAELVLNSL